MPSKCPYDPMEMCGKPIGMYHCPLCGEMVLACVEHPDYDLLDDDLLDNGLPDESEAAGRETGEEHG